MKRLPRTATKKQLYRALNLLYVGNGGIIRYRYRSIRRDFFTPDYVQSRLGLPYPDFQSKKTFSRDLLIIICEDFDITPDDFPEE